MDDVLDALEQLKLVVTWDKSTQTLSWNPEIHKQQIESDTSPEVDTMMIFAQISTVMIACLRFTWGSPAANDNCMMADLNTYRWAFHVELGKHSTLILPSPP